VKIGFVGVKKKKTLAFSGEANYLFILILYIFALEIEKSYNV
jgi:hypothetical protein